MTSTINEVKVKYDMKAYEPKMPYPNDVKKLNGYIFDDELSVKKNREMVEQFNSDIINKKNQYRQAQTEALRQLTEDVIKAIMDEYGFNREVADKIRSKVCSDHDSYSGDFFDYLVEYCDLMEEVLWLQAEWRKGKDK